MQKNINLQKMFLEKRYSEIIFIIDHQILDKQKNSAIMNLLGLCRILKSNKTKEDLKLAIKDFKAAYLKEINTQDSLEAFRNFVNASVNLYDFEKTIGNRQIAVEYFKEALRFLENNESFYSKNELVILQIIRIYKRFVNIKKVISYLEKLINQNNNRPLTLCSYIYNNCFFSEWDQEKFLHYSNMLNKILPVYDKKKLVPLSQSIKNKKIKIGFFSADIKSNHSVTYFLKTIINHYDKDRFEIYLYFNNKKTFEDQTTKYFKNLINKFVNIYVLSDERAINLIREDKIDIFIDLMGITSESRLALVKNRVSPVQILWCGYCNTTGVDGMDYILSDKNLIYNAEKHLYKEKIIFLPQIWNCHSGFNLKRSFNPSPFIKNKEITLGSFNNFSKINDEVILTWSKILKSIKNAKLMLKPSSTREIDFLADKFCQQNILDSVKFVSSTKDFTDHINLYKEIDIALDTFPYNGVTTSFEAIWMNVPVLTMKGYNFNSRCGESINKSLGLDYLIAKDEGDYVLKMNELVKNKDKLLNIRKLLFDNVISSPLFDAKTFSRDFFNILLKTVNK